MNSTGSTPEPTALPNPFTPLAFLPPELAFQRTIAVYVLVGTLAVTIWDILNNLRGDLQLVFTYPINLPIVVYLLSRLATLAFVMATTIYETAPVHIPCRTLCSVTVWLFAVAISSTGLLFLIRVRAIFYRSKSVRAFFCVMWLVVLAGVVASTQGVTGGNIGPTRYCMNVQIADYVGAAMITPLVNDTLVFLAISWRLMRNSHVELQGHPLRGGIKMFFFGDYLPPFSRGLLQDGQVYYLTTVTATLISVVIFFFPFVPVVYRAMLAAPNVALMNMMACRVYRRTRVGRYSESGHPSALPSSSSQHTATLLLFLPNRNGQSRSNGMGQRSEHIVEVIEVASDKTEEHT